MSARVKVGKIIDPRLEASQGPAFAVNFGPQQNQVYKIPNSGLSQTSFNFSNIVPLGVNRAFEDSFAIEVTVEITFHYTQASGASARAVGGNEYWCFDSFPLSKCTDEIRCNVNGAAFFSYPLSYLRAKERFWSDRQLIDSYGNTCPCNKPYMGNESGQLQMANGSGWPQAALELTQRSSPCRCSPKIDTFGLYATGVNGVNNNFIVDPNLKLDQWLPAVDNNAQPVEYTKTFTCTWREPILCSPFSTKFDQTYGRPLYNITTLDINYNLQSLKNMIRYVPQLGIDDYTVTLKDAVLCYQVLTIPPEIIPPPVTTTLYRRYVPYITQYPSPLPVENNQDSVHHISSGVYTLNEVPQAIWIFVGPTKQILQSDVPDQNPNPNIVGGSCRSWNKLFCTIEKVSLSCANTTQIFDTFSKHDLYRMAKENGCQDTFAQWSETRLHSIGLNAVRHLINPETTAQTLDDVQCTTVGSVLRVIPGKDIIIPDQMLIPGANADNMVFQAHVDFRMSDGWMGTANRTPALWLLFEYVGVATITPGQCNITMNPLGNGIQAMKAPAVSGAQILDGIGEQPTEFDGGGWFDKIISFFRNNSNRDNNSNTENRGPGIIEGINQGLKDSKILSNTILPLVPVVGGPLSTAARMFGYGEKGMKRKRNMSGGAIMGMGDFV